MSHICAISLQPGRRPCVLRGQHAQHCDGHARAWRGGRSVILEDECPGCLPRPVSSGVLCDFHADRAETALARVAQHVAHLWILNGSAAVDANDSRAGGFTPNWTLKASRVQASETGIALAVWAVRHYQDAKRAVRPNLAGISPHRGFPAGAALADVHGAAVEAAGYLQDADGPPWSGHASALAAVALAGAVTAGVRAFPVEDAPHDIPALRCRTCDHLSLQWRPPLFYRDEDVIQCSHCGQVEDRRLIEHDMRVILELHKGARR